MNREIKLEKQRLNLEAEQNSADMEPKTNFEELKNLNGYGL